MPFGPVKVQVITHANIGPDGISSGLGAGTGSGWLFFGFRKCSGISPLAVGPALRIFQATLAATSTKLGRPAPPAVGVGAVGRPIFGEAVGTRLILGAGAGGATGRGALIGARVGCTGAGPLGRYGSG